MSNRESSLKEKFRIALNSTAKVISDDFSFNKTNNDKNTKATASYLHLPHTKKNKRTNKIKVIVN